MISTKDMLNALIGTKHFKKSIAGSRKSDKPFVDLHRPLIVYPDSMKNPQNFFAYGELKGEYICVVKIVRKNSISTRKKM